jgi:hypothetical protein
MSQFFDSDTGLPNLHAPYLIPEEFRIRHQLMIRMFDRKFQPFFTGIFPKEPSRGLDGAVGVEKFDWPVMTSTRPMSRLYGRDEPTQYINAGGIKTEYFNTVITKAGFVRRYDEFEHDFTFGLISKKYRILAEEIVEAVNKRIEFECGNILYHNTWAVNQYSKGIDMNRALVADISGGKFYLYDHSTEISDLASLLTGLQWSNSSSDPYRDFAVIKRAHEDMMGREITTAFLGPETIMWLDINPTMKETVKYVKDLSNGVLGTTVQGVTIHKVIGNDLKEEAFYSGNAAPPMYYPGMGDLDYDKWSDRNKVPLMVDGGVNGKEWGVMAEEEVGNLFHSWINTKHQAQVGSPVIPYSKIKEQDDPDRRMIRIEKAFCPAVYDWGRYVLLLNTCNRSNRT